MKWLLKLLPIKVKIALYDALYKDIGDQGEEEDRELAHVNAYEISLLKSVGGTGKVNKKTGLKGYFGGGGGGGPAPAPASSTTTGTQTTISREAPEIESRKLSLYDEALALSRTPVEVPSYQVAGPSPLQQQAFTQAGQMGVGQPTLTSGIGSVLGAQTGAAQLPDITSFLNPFQSYVTDEINRQAAIGQNQLAAQAIDAGAFGGGREGIQQAEAERARLQQIGLAQQQGYTQALGAAQDQQKFQTETGLAAGAQLAGMGAQQQGMNVQDAQTALQAGGAQQQLAQQALTAQRQTEVARAYEPYQRIEFQKGIMTALPTAASQVTAGTGPAVNPLAQAASTGLGAYAAYNLLKPTGL